MQQYLGFKEILDTINQNMALFTLLFISEGSDICAVLFSKYILCT